LEVSGQSPTQELLQGVEQLLPTPSKDGSAKGTARPATASDPVGAIRLDLLASANLLTKGQVGGETIQLQQEILARMDELIQAMMRNADAGTSDSQRNSQTAPTAASIPESQIRAGREPMTSSKEEIARKNERPSQPKSPPGRPVPNGDPNQRGTPGSGPAGEKGTNGLSSTGELQASPWLRKGIWGTLPERVRREMQTAPSQKFLPSYRRSIEEYYRRLAEDRSTQDE
jgi:hypothetical protein